MSHVTEGQIQTLLDGEIAGEGARALVAHMDACPVCAQAYAAQETVAAQAHQAFVLLDDRPASTAAAFAAVVGAREETPTRRFDAHRSAGRPARVGFLKAAMLVLFASGAAAAAIPGSPVQRWLGETWQRWTGEDAPAPVSAPAPVVETPVAADEDLASIAIEPVGGAVEVSLRGLPAGVALRVEIVDSDRATVLAADAPLTRFATGPGSLQAVLDDRASSVTVQLPRTATRAMVYLDGETVVSRIGGELTVRGPVVERTGDVILFRD